MSPYKKEVWSLAGWLLAAVLAGLAGWLAGWLGWLAGWLAGLACRWLGWLAGWLAGWLGWLVAGCRMSHTLELWRVGGFLIFISSFHTE